jgi:hypothetical protein
MPNYKSWSIAQLQQRVATLQGRFAELKSLTARHPRGSPQWRRAHDEGIAVQNELRKIEDELAKRR